MTDWTSGYVADIGYTFGYYQELNPLAARATLLQAGIVPPEIRTACELGFGQGLSLNIHAAASDIEWYGTDFNPAQASFARELAAASGANAKIYDDAFADFAQRPELPDFDYIGLHGIWSWISDENRRVIAEFVRRKLKVGGVLYVSYNTLPGWSAFAPMRHLMTRHAEIIGAAGRGIVSRIDDALAFANKLLATKPLFAKANPQVRERLDKLTAQNRHYLAHEYFNRDWHPMHFATMAEWLEPAKVQYACSAHCLDHIDLINLSAEQQAFLKEIPDGMFRESVRDFLVNQQFRRDYWVKGARRLPSMDQLERLRAQKYILVTPRASVSLKASGALGEANLTEAVYGPMLDLLSDYEPKSLGELEAALAGKSINLAQILQCVLVLGGNRHLAPTPESADAPASTRKRADALNRRLMQKATFGGDVVHLASPVSGTGVLVDRFQQLFLSALEQGKPQAEWPAFVWGILDRQGQRILKDGATIESAEENLAELTKQAQTFAERLLPLLRKLQIA